jgi:hypothetical protein
MVQALVKGEREKFVFLSERTQTDKVEYRRKALDTNKRKGRSDRRRGLTGMRLRDDETKRRRENIEEKQTSNCECNW